jgi:hypothetical protein
MASLFSQEVQEGTQAVQQQGGEVQTAEGGVQTGGHVVDGLVVSHQHPWTHRRYHWSKICWRRGLLPYCRGRGLWLTWAGGMRLEAEGKIVLCRPAVLSPIVFVLVPFGLCDGPG